MPTNTLKRLVIVAVAALTLVLGGVTGPTETALARPRVDGGTVDCVAVSGAEANLILGRTDLDVHAEYLVCHWPGGGWTVNRIRGGAYR
jgi:hypothetical protein